MVLEILATSKSLIEVTYIRPSDQCEYFTPVLPLPRNRSVDKFGNRIYYSTVSLKGGEDVGGGGSGSGSTNREFGCGTGKTGDSVLYLDCDFRSNSNEGGYSGVSFLRVKCPSNGSFFEEQEISAFIVECPYEDAPLTLYGAGLSTFTTNESVYSEPIYGHSNNELGTNFTTESSSSGPLSPISWSQQSSHSNSNNYADTHNMLSDYNNGFPSSSPGFPDPYPWSTQNHPNHSSHYSSRQRDFNCTFSGLRTLPPPPTQSRQSERNKAQSATTSTSSENTTTNPNKFSSIAKTAGRKIAKKLLSMRRVSRTSFDIERNHATQQNHSHENHHNQNQQNGGYNRCLSAPGLIHHTKENTNTSSTSSFENGRPPLSMLPSTPSSMSMSTPPSPLSTSTYENININNASPGSSSGNIARRLIPRPSIPPPEPPSIPTTPLLSTEPIHPYRNPPAAVPVPVPKIYGHHNINSDTEELYGHRFQNSNNSNSNSTHFSSPARNFSKGEYNNYKSNHHNNYRDDNDDYADSDFYDSDSDLIRNFVSAVQPIYSIEEEPLYQYYTYGISLKPEDEYQPVIPKNLGLTIDMLIPRVGQRTLWCELPEVKSSGILGILCDKQKQLQEAIFEILTSEVSYLKSLDVLISLFNGSYELTNVLTEEEYKYIWGNITQVRKCSQSFNAALLTKWEESWYIQEIGEMINSYALHRFSAYKEYCRNKPHQDRTLQKLRMTNDEFVSVVKSIEENPRCQMLRMDSFLMLPMQRITRLPLLVNAIIQRTQSLKEKAYCEEALKNLTNLVLDCNEAARESQDEEDTSAIIEKIDFPRNLQNITLGNFILKGDFMKNPFDHNGGKGANQINWTFRKTKRTYYCLLLFSKNLLVAKKKSSGRFEIIDCAESSDSNIKPLPNVDAISKDFQYFFMLHFNLKEAVYFLGARTQSEVERWRQKLENLKKATVMEEKVEAIFPYKAQREDEMSFDAGDVIRVVQKQADGWYFGMKMMDSSDTGWFPGNYCCEC